MKKPLVVGMLSFLAVTTSEAGIAFEGPVEYRGEAGKGRAIVTVEIPETDLTGCDRMVVDVINEGPEDDEICVHIADATEKPDTSPYTFRGMRRRYWAEVGRSVWTAEIGMWNGKGNRRKISRLHFFCIRPFGSKMTLRNVRFLAPGEKDVAVSLPADGKRRADALAKESAARKKRRHDEALERFRKACVSAGTERAGMLVGKASSMEQIRPKDADSLAESVPASSVSVRLARDEYECFQILVTPSGSGLRNVSVSVAGDLKGADGAVFAAGNVTCCVTGYVRTRGVASYTVGKSVPDPSREGGYRLEIVNPRPGWWADPILSFMKETDVDPGTLQSFWIEVKCPPNQRPGLYGGELEVKAAGIGGLRIPFSVRVNSFAVPRSSPLPLAITFRPRMNKFFETAADAEMYRRAKDDPKAPANAWSRRRSLWSDFLSDRYIMFDNLYCNELNPNRDWDLYARQLARGRKGAVNLGYWGEYGSGSRYDVYFREVLMPQYRTAYEAARRLGIADSAYLYGADEIGASKFGAAAKTVRKLKEAFPEVKVMTTARDHDFGVGNELSCVDVFVPLTRWYDVAKADKARSEGRKVYWYIADGPENGWANSNTENPPADLRCLMGFQSVRMRPDGFLFWQISAWNSPRPITSGPFTSWETRTWILWNGQGCWTAAGPDGIPLSTLRLENFRDGLEDYAYAGLLRRKLASASDPVLKKKAEDLLAVPVAVMKKMDDFNRDPVAIYAWRDAIADLIESMP